MRNIGCKTLSFKLSISSIRIRISSWKTLLLAQERRNTLIRLVASTVLVYNMSVVLQRPNKTIRMIEKMFRRAFLVSEHVGLLSCILGLAGVVGLG